MTDAELERLVRYCHPEKLLAGTPLPGAAALADAQHADLYGTSPERYRAVAGRLRDEACAAARELAAGDTLRGRVDAIRRAAGQRIVAFGDSHTDDLASWAEILRHLLATDVVNAGVSGDTTTAALARLDRLPAAGLAVVLIGTNDARRHGPGAPMLVSHAETARNLRLIDAALRKRCARVIWITPPPVDEHRIAHDAQLAADHVTWRADDVAAKAALVRGGWRDAIDLWPLLGPRHLAADGLHPSGAGQRLIAERVAGALLW